MHRSWLTIVLVLATLGAALMAGTFFIFSVAVMPALRKLDAARAAAAMNSINTTILNPVFLGAFVGTAVLAVVVVVTGFTRGEDPSAPWLVTGGLLYALGVFGVTAVLNVPLNDQLARAAADAPSLGAAWASYEPPWTRWNHVRTVASIGATLTWVVAALHR
ncbi:MAG TPA: anthrone oxygenase family protein [Myxococcaceae bacterium]|nr:anthrone oxygenase family protein [Myxococcaceae bacterium]